uniref:N-acetylglucosaminylphosphatidylinositol deacetylase n=1 Tax=Meloidogyne incognita TaxID=6306 RepID=A0A914L3J1_MELIC
MEITLNRSPIKLVCLSLFVSLIAIFFTLFLSFENKNRFPAYSGEVWYLFIAHPDDETMFFSPTLFTLKSVGVVLHIFCITSGDSDGNGLIRIKELSEASNTYGIPNDHVHILDPNGKIFVDGFVEWNITSLAEILLKRIKQPPKGIITFDEWGVSGHPNHINCFKTIKLLTKRWNNTKFFALQSVPLWRKYLGFFDVYLTELLEGNKQIVYITWSGPISAYKIMTNHYKSQMRWFRYFYLIFSRYLYINNFVGTYMV